MGAADVNIREELAKAIYNTHRRADGPIWENLSDSIRDWVREQAKTAENLILMHLRSEAR